MRNIGAACRPARSDSLTRVHPIPDTDFDGLFLQMRQPHVGSVWSANDDEIPLRAEIRVSPITDCLDHGSAQRRKYRCSLARPFRADTDHIDGKALSFRVPVVVIRQCGSPPGYDLPLPRHGERKMDRIRGTSRDSP